MIIIETLRYLTFSMGNEIGSRIHLDLIFLWNPLVFLRMELCSNDDLLSGMYSDQILCSATAKKECYSNSFRKRVTKYLPIKFSSWGCWSLELSSFVPSYRSRVCMWMFLKYSSLSRIFISITLSSLFGLQIRPRTFMTVVRLSFLRFFRNLVLGLEFL